MIKNDKIFFSPSQANQWFVCNKSLFQKKEEAQSFPSKKGILCHKILEECLKKGEMNLTFKEFYFQLRKITENNCSSHFFSSKKNYSLLTKSFKILMKEKKNKDTLFFSEKTVEFKKQTDFVFQGKKQILKFEGTADAFSYNRKTQTLKIYDLKTGNFPINPTQNKQLLFYGLGVLSFLCERCYDVKKIQLIVLQSQENIVSVQKKWTINKDILTLFWELFEQKFENFKVDPNKTKLNNLCKFCSFYIHCHVLKGKEIQVLAQNENSLEKISEKSLYEILYKEKKVNLFFKKAKEQAEQIAKDRDSHFFYYARQKNNRKLSLEKINKLPEKNEFFERTLKPFSRLSSKNLKKDVFEKESFIEKLVLKKKIDNIEKI